MKTYWGIWVVLGLWGASDGQINQGAAATLSRTFPNPTPDAADYYAWAVTCVGTEHVVIGAYEDKAYAREAGAVYIFKANGTLFRTLTNPVPARFDWFGKSVASLGNDRIIVGADGDDRSAVDAGAAYLFNMNGTLLTAFANPTPAALDNFGVTVAGVGTDKVLVGAPGNDKGATDAGAAFLFRANGTLLHTFTNPAPAAFDSFGQAVAAVGTDKVIIGAYLDDAGGTNSGLAYLFDLNGTLLTSFAKPNPTEGDYFGYAVAGFGEDRVLIGAYQDDIGAVDAGAAYLFNTDGTLLMTFTNPSPAAYEYFGRSVAAVGTDRVLIGAHYEGSGAPIGGAAYLFSTNGTLLATLASSSPLSGDRVGGAVAALGNDRVLVGAYGYANYTGAAYLFDLEPRLNCPNDIFAPALAGSGGVEVQFAVPAAPSTFSNATVTCVPAPGSIFPVGVTTVVCTATDILDNTNTCTFDVTVEEEANGDTHDLAVVRIRAPRVVTLTAAKPVITKRVVVTIQNRGPHTESFVNPSQLRNLVALTVNSFDENACVNIVPVFLDRPPQRRLPFNLRSKQMLNLYFDVTFDCAVNPARGVGAEDFSYTAQVFHQAISGISDTHPACDVCPRPPLPTGVDPNPNGRIRDKGCGAPAGGGLFGNPVLTDVVVK